MTRSRAEWRLAPPTHYRLQRDDDAQPFILSSMPVSFHSYKHAKSKSVPTLVAVSAKQNPQFGLIGILNRNMYKRAHDDHPHHLPLLSLRRWARVPVMARPPIVLRSASSLLLQRTLRADHNLHLFSNVC